MSTPLSLVKQICG